MKKSLILLAGLLLARTVPGFAQTAADTLPGQSRFVRRLAATMCQCLEAAARRQAFTGLSSAQADELFSRLMNESSSEHVAEMNALLAEAKRRHVDVMQASRRLGQAVVPVLTKKCPRAKELLLHSSLAKNITSEEIADFQRLTPPEKAVLQPAATNACNRLSAENKRRPLAQRSPEEVRRLLNQAVQAELGASAAALLRVYGAKKYASAENTREVYLKLVYLMAASCPDYLASLEARQPAK